MPIAGATPSSGTATLKTTIPPGLVRPGHQWVDVVAVYGGDASHLASTSAKVGVGFGPLSFAIDPVATTMPVNGTKSFSATGGSTPVSWFVAVDTTQSQNGGAFVDPTSGSLMTGPTPGYVVVEAIDRYGAEALAQVTVGSATGTPPWEMDAGPFIDGGVPPALPGSSDAGHDASVIADSAAPSHEASDEDASVASGGEAHSGGGCSVGRTPPASPLDSGLLACVPFAVGLFVRRRRR